MYGQNIAKSSDRSDFFTAADVFKCANVIKALNLFNVELQNKKDEMAYLHLIFLKGNSCDKGGNQ